MFTLRPLTAADAHDIAGWRYPGPYAFYDTAADPQDLAELLDVGGWAPDSHFGAWDDALGDAPLAGFFTFEQAERGAGWGPSRRGGTCATSSDGTTRSSPWPSRSAPSGSAAPDPAGT